MKSTVIFTRSIRCLRFTRQISNVCAGSILPAARRISARSPEGSASNRLCPPPRLAESSLNHCSRCSGLSAGRVGLNRWCSRPDLCTSAALLSRGMHGRGPEQSPCSWSCWHGVCSTELPDEAHFRSSRYRHFAVRYM